MNPEKFQPTWATKSKPTTFAASSAAAPASAAMPTFPAIEAQPQAATTTATRPVLYNPKLPPSPRRRRRGFCCLCMLFTTLILFTLLVLAVVAAAVVYAVYHPRRPTFSLSSLHVSSLNFSSPAAFSSSLPLSVSAHNPNSKIAFSYDPISVSVFSSSAVQIAAGGFPGFVHSAKNTTHLAADVTSKGLRVSNREISAMKNKVKREKGLDLEIQMETKVRVRFGKSTTKKMGFKVFCNGIKANPNLKGKFTGSAKTSGVKCKGKLRFKIWKWNFSS